MLSADGAGDIAHRYLHGPAVDQVLADEKPVPSAANEVQWLLGDHLGTIRDVASVDGDTVDHVTYDTFGTPMGLPSDVLFGFTGREWDGDAELYYYRARWYDPIVGRFASEDPLGFAGHAVNLALYGYNAPSRLADNSGLYAFQPPDDASPCFTIIYPDGTIILYHPGLPCGSGFIPGTNPGFGVPDQKAVPPIVPTPPDGGGPGGGPHIDVDVDVNVYIGPIISFGSPLPFPKVILDFLNRIGELFGHNKN